MSDEPQDVAEALDEDRVDEVDDYSGDEFGEAYAGFPPDRPLGVNTVGVTPVEEDGGESFAERTYREQPEPGLDELDRPVEPASPDEPGLDVGQLVDSNATTLDREAAQVADALPATDLGPEEAAMHLEDDSA